jgi:hypothetical protein
MLIRLTLLASALALLWMSSGDGVPQVSATIQFKYYYFGNQHDASQTKLWVNFNEVTGAHNGATAKITQSVGTVHPSIR